MPISLPRVAALDAAVAVLLLPSMPCRSAAAAAVFTSPHCAATAALTVLHCDAAGHRVSEHMGLPLAVSRRRLAINDTAAAHAAPLPAPMHACVWPQCHVGGA